MAPADLSAAWDAIISEQRLDDIDALRAEGWLTVSDYRERVGLTDAAARGRLSALLEAGVLERKTVRIQTRNGMRSSIAYRPQT